MYSPDDGDAPMTIVGFGFPTVAEVPPDISSPFLSRRRGQERLKIETVADLIDALAPYRSYRVFIDAGLDDVGIVGDVVFVDDEEILLDIIPQDGATSDG